MFEKKHQKKLLIQKMKTARKNPFENEQLCNIKTTININKTLGVLQLSL